MVSILCMIYLVRIYWLPNDDIRSIIVFKNISMVYMKIIYYQYNHQDK